MSVFQFQMRLRERGGKVEGRKERGGERDRQDLRGGQHSKALKGLILSCCRGLNVCAPSPPLISIWKPQLPRVMVFGGESLGGLDEVMRVVPPEK